MTDLEKKLLAEQQNRASADFGTGALLMRPEDTSIQKASEDFMQYLQNPTEQIAPPAPVSNPSAIEDFGAMMEQDAIDKSLKAPVAAAPQIMNKSSVMSANMGSTASMTSPASTPQDDILAQLKAARDANEVSMNAARQADKSTELGNLIMKSGAMAGEGIVNRAGNTNIKLSPAQIAAEEANFAGSNNKSKLEALMQDYGIKKGMDDTAYSRKKDAETRQDKLNELAFDRQYKNKMLDIAADKTKSDKKEQDNAGQKKLDQEFAKEYQEWSSGGEKIAQSEIGKLKSALNNMKTGKVTTGGLTGLFPDQLTSNKVLSARSDIQSSVMGSLRALLGAQFTEKEGERVIKNTWNEADSTENNINRVERLVGDLENKAADKSQKAAFFEQKGSTLKGFEGDFKNKTPVSTGPYGDTVDRNGKAYKWNSSVGKYQPIQ